MTREVYRTAVGDLGPRFLVKQLAVDSGHPESWLQGWVDWDVIETMAHREAVWLAEVEDRAADRDRAAETQHQAFRRSAERGMDFT